MENPLSLSIYLSIYRSIDLSIYRSIDLSIDRSIDLSIYRSIDLSIYRSIDLSIYRSIYLSIFLSFYLCIYLSIFLSIYRLSIYLSNMVLLKGKSTMNRGLPIAMFIGDHPNTVPFNVAKTSPGLGQKLSTAGSKPGSFKGNDA